MDNLTPKTEYVIFIENSDGEQNFITDVYTSSYWSSTNINKSMRFNNVKHAFNFAEYISLRENKKVYVGKIETSFSIVQQSVHE